ncbi:FERM, ARHGEF and pleckstrin domain-containing protein 2 isoform X2 [Erinaceus europaeus]|uniref:FERM, ARHGEF and pleckstrin domain-containing protein 2 isoform X2 n=1 Tax=Erinaceus europaeus TaxID=9365 RepID=A0A1S3WMI6_ERIEU|nr:FERM, ARHGEF and pleckstrin domain-containing protein 2 isoform X2 [Erinaceus europaeus]
MDGTYRALPTPASRLGTRTPAGVSSLEPGQTLGTRPVAPPRDKCLTVHVRLLDDSMEMLDVEPKCDGQVLLAQLWGRLNLMECDYFGLEFQNAPSCWVWLDPAKPLARQVRRPKNTVLRLAVKFFPPDPGQLQEEFTRYLFALQLRRDLREGRLSCTDTTAALLASHLLQAELGDYEETLDREHLKAHQYLPSQEHCLEKILEFHQKHMGQTPAESDFQVLEVARKLEMYGVRLHAASDREGARIHLAAFHTGVLVFQGTTKINTFNWSKVRKLSFRRKRFLVKLHPEAHGPYQDTLEFLLGSRDACKNFWKVCVEHHTFFRLCDQPKPKAKAVLFSRGSSFRYSGRTQKQLVGCIKEGPMRRAPYERRHSRMRACIQETRQSVSFTEGLRTSASPPPADTTPGSLPTSPLAPRGHLSLQDNSGPQLEPPALDTMRPAAEGSHRPPCQAQTPGAPAGPPSPGTSSEDTQHPPCSRGSRLSLDHTLQDASPLPSPILSQAGGEGLEEESSCQGLVVDEAYFIAKEILATERTHVKDLEVIAVWFRSAVLKEGARPTQLAAPLFSSIDPMYEFHRNFLRQLEQRLTLWEGGALGHQRVGDMLLRNMLQLQALTEHLQRHGEVLAQLEEATRHCGKLEVVRRDFELQRVCHLPLSAFLLKPLQRPGHYRRLLSRLCRLHGHTDCHDALQAVTEVTTALQPSLSHLENWQRLTELQRELTGVGDLATPGREFIREGCLHTFTRKGLQQRMFFLFSDVLLYTAKAATGTGHFRIRGLLPLRGMLVDEHEADWAGRHCFSIYAARRTMVVVASSRLEKEKWMQDLKEAIEATKYRTVSPTPLHKPSSPDLCSRTDWSPDSPDTTPMEDWEDDAPGPQGSPEGQAQPRAHSTPHVCWYRSTSVSRADHSAVGQNQLSGYLLRKFKNSGGWQKLWVVFTNFCLFFYKTHQDDHPLASLPLLGYRVSEAGPGAGGGREHVFKLQFKSHIYFFRAESEYTLSRYAGWSPCPARGLALPHTHPV